MRIRSLSPLLATVLLGSLGCSGGTVLKGIVKLDGTPVEGATVVFMAEDAKTTYSGVTDSGGNFTLKAADNKSGIPSGTYKVTVVKTAALTTGPIDPKSPEYMKMMEKDSKEESSKGGGPPKGVMMPGMKMPGGGAGGAKQKSELPEIYSSATTTPLTVKVPADTNPVVIELTANKK